MIFRGCVFTKGCYNMPEDLKDIIRRLKADRKTAIEVQKWLRDNNYAIPWVETKRIYIQV